MNLHIEGQRIQVEPDTQAWITQRLEALNEPYQDILHARVTLVKHERHHQGSDEARVLLTLSGKTLNAARRADTLDDALYDVLQVITRELREFRDIRQHAVKTPSPRMRGRIARLFPERGYGFIETESHHEVYFHANSIHDMSFETLAVGMPVELDLESGHAGPQASRVMPQKP